MGGMSLSKQMFNVTQIYGKISLKKNKKGHQFLFLIRSDKERIYIIEFIVHTHIFYSNLKDIVKN